MKRKLTVIILAVCMVWTLLPATAFSEDGMDQKPEMAKTVVRGLNLENTVSIKSAMRDTITIGPAYGRTLELQCYNPKKKKWETKAAYQTKNQKSAKITLNYPSRFWKKEKYTKWRLYASRTEKGDKYISQTIRLITRNRANLKLACKSAVIINGKSGVILYSKDMNKKRPQASITKITTAILALEHNSLSKKVTISKKSAQTPFGAMDLKQGDRIYLKHLLYAALLPSDNGCAVAIAEQTAGSEARFVRMMNEKAQKLGCKNTHFRNPHGLDQKDHYSTAYDIALMTQYAIKKKAFRTIVKTRTYSFKSLKKGKRYHLKSTNKLLGKVTGVSGAKTGTTENAGYCFAGVYADKGKTYITVVLGDKKDAQRWADTKKLIGYVKKYGW